MSDPPRQAVSPKLVVDGADAAIAFYVRALGAREVVRFSAGRSVVFAELEVLGSRVQLKDADEHDPVAQPGPVLDVTVEDPDALGARLVAAGATWVFEPSDKPWGGRWGRVRDPFGVQWLLQDPDRAGAQEIQALLDG
jgi:PhnB protein